MSWNLDINIDEQFSDVSEKSLREVVDLIMAHEGVESQVELSILVTDDLTVHDLNLRYRGIDATTDVLAFSLQEGEDFPSVSGENTQLGEVIISRNQAFRQAVEHGHTLETELVILIIHGVLHLLGYDHQDESSEEEMVAREKSILTKFVGTNE